MKTLFCNAALVLSVLSLGAAVRPVSVVTPAKSTMVSMVPTCPPGDPNGCGIFK